jgi:PLP dependent protein
MSPAASDLAENLARVRERIDQAARRAERRPDAVKLLAVTKGLGPDVVQTLWRLGLRDFGESRVQEALPKIAAAPAASWHLIGHLQENKINKVLPWVSMIQSVDSYALAQAISARATKQGRTVPILLEVKTSEEPAKHGFDPESAAVAYATVADLPGVSLQGLMTIAPLTTDTSRLRQSFRTLRHLFERLQVFQPPPRILSMGMSDDLELAVEEGSTLVRVGRALVGA